MQLTGVRSTAAEEQSGQRTTVAGDDGCRPAEIQLVQRHRAVEYVLHHNTTSLPTVTWQDGRVAGRASDTVRCDMGIPNSKKSPIGYNGAPHI